VPPVTKTVKNLSIPATVITSLNRESYDQQTKQEYAWLNYTKEVLLSSKIDFSMMNVSWAAYHASQQFDISQAIWPTVLLPLFPESAWQWSNIPYL